MQRYKLTIEYCGTHFHGWQQQNGLRSVQTSIQQAVFQFCGEHTFVYGAGRTDAGVHATGQVAHFDIQKNTTEKSVCSALNHFLKNTGIAILSAESVPQTFHARFSAKSRSYIYSILNRATHTPLYAEFTWHIPEKLDVNLMNQAAQLLVGFHDFESFRSTQCQAKSAKKSIDFIYITKNDDVIKIDITAKSFLHNQVRIIVGTLRKIGNKSWPVNTIQDILIMKNRCRAGQTAPAGGLCLYKVEY